MEPIVLQKQLMENAEQTQSYINSLKDWESEMQKKEEKLLQLKTNMNDVSLDNKITRHETADVHKNTGNKYVKNGSWELAIQEYTKAIQLYEDDPAYYGNRSYCYLMLNNLQASEQDCNRALDLKPDYVKVALRRASVRRKLGNIHGAAKDYNLVLILQPKNVSALKEYEEIYPELKAHFNDLGIDLPEFTEMNPSVLKDEGGSVDEGKPLFGGTSVNKNKNQMNMNFLFSEDKNINSKSVNKRKKINSGDLRAKNFRFVDEVMKDYKGDYAMIKPIYFIPPHKRSKLALRRIVIDDLYVDSSE